MTVNVSMQTGGYALPVFYTDFNMLDSDKRVPVLRGDWDLSIGQKVVLQDHDGNRCYGRVRAIQPKVYKIRALLSTWHDGPYEL